MQCCPKLGFGFFDHALRYVRLNPALAELDGLPVEAHLGRTMPDVLPRMSPEVFDAFREVLRTGTSVVNREFPDAVGQQSEGAGLSAA